MGGLRGQVHAACGTEKTIIAAAVARRLVPHGRVLVPTPDLLTQTVAAWHGPGVARQRRAAHTSLSRKWLS